MAVEQLGQLILQGALEEQFPWLERGIEGAGDLSVFKGIGQGNPERQMSDSLNLIYVVKKGRILSVAEKMSKGAGEYKDLSHVCPPEVSVPDSDPGLQIGDNVKIKYGLPEFKAIQKKTAGWSSDFGFLIHETGFITESVCLSPRVRVCFPTKNKHIVLHASVLEKISSPAYTRPDFKTNDTVVINSDREVVSLLQRGMGDLPKETLGKKAKVVGVSLPAIFVSLDGKRVWAVRAALLRRLEEEFITPEEEESSYKIGDKVKVIENVKKLIKQQERHGGWNPEMSSIIGEELTVFHVVKDVVGVAESGGKIWHLNEKSLFPVAEPPTGTDAEEDVSFALKQKVKVHFPNMVKVLNDRKIPLEFLEFLQCPAVVQVYDDKLKAGIRFNSEQNIMVTTNILAAASEKQIDRANEVQAAVEAFKAGSEVCLDVGPTNFVLRVLQNAGVSDKIIKALTTTSTILGFDGPYHAVIGYPNGDKFRINKKYLTVPKKFKIHEVEQNFQPETIGEIKKMISECLEALPTTGNVAAKAQKVKFISAQHGVPPTIRFTIMSFTATMDAIVEALKSRCVVTKLAEGVLEARGFQSYEGAVILQLFLNDEGVLPGYHEFEKPAPPTVAVSESANTVTGGPTEVPAKAYREMGHPVGDVGAGEAPPPVDVVGGRRFQYMRLNDPSLGKVVLVPYLLVDHTMGEAGAEPPQQQQQPSSGVNVNAGQGTTVNIYS